MKTTCHQNVLPSPKAAKSPSAKRAKTQGAAEAAKAAPPLDPGPSPIPDPGLRGPAQGDSEPGASTLPVTSIVSKINVGFGNRLFIRGEGGGLAWDRGLPMECVASSEWHWRTEAAQAPLVFKVLLNDDQWSHGDNFTAWPGQRAEITPAFA